VVVAIDADAVFNHPEIPLEWLFNHWNITNNTAITMSIDPDEKANYDVYGKLNNNAGFIIAQNLPRTHEMLRAWAACPDEPSEAYAKCSRWKKPWPAEQAAFSEYIRYIYADPNDVHELPCDEANGFPESDKGCAGRFLRHMWWRKWDIKHRVDNGIMQYLMAKIQKQFMLEKGTHIDRPTNDFTRKRPAKR
jgi:hypothetical protein